MAAPVPAGRKTWPRRIHASGSAYADRATHRMASVAGPCFNNEQVDDGFGISATGKANRGNAMISLAQTRRASAPQWHHVRLEAQELAQREHERMKLRFNRLYMAARRPRGMRLWMTLDDDNGADVYLSPKAAPRAGNLIRRYQARPCDPPGRSTMLIAGDGYAVHGPCAQAPPARTTAAGRRFLPAPSTYRCVRSLVRRRVDDPAPPSVDNQMAPFVRRYAKAWGLSPPPRRHGRWNQGVHPAPERLSTPRLP